MAQAEFAIVAVGLVLLLGLCLGAINGALIVVTRVPDIVVTLAMFLRLAGRRTRPALPGGAAADWLKAMVVGTVSIPGVPSEITGGSRAGWCCSSHASPPCSSALPVAARLSIYAIGSNNLAAFRSGVAVGRTRIAAYALAGLFSAMGGLVLTMSTGIGAPIPGPYLLASVAAVVLGGVALTGGVGGIVGPIVAVFILRLVRSDLTFLAVDPNVTTIVEGTTW
jgi:ribose transport system permease protein